jgi:RNA polymerase sigma factor (sigma-70 family)
MSAHDTTLFEQARRDRRARERVVEQHLPSVRAAAKHYSGLNVPFDDLVQEGCIGLLDAIETFDPARGVDFDRFARFKIRCAIRDALTQSSRLVRLPKRVVERRRIIDRTEAELTAAEGRAPSAREIAAVLGVPPETVVATPATQIIWAPLEPPLDQLLADAAAVEPGRDAARREELARLEVALSALPARQRELVSRRFGLGCPPEDLTDVARSLHVSRQRARAIEQAALYALRDRLDPLRPNEGGKRCTRTFSLPMDRSTEPPGRSRRRLPRHSERTASTRTPSLR